jgi:hypothetical protein
VSLLANRANNHDGQKHGAHKYWADVSRDSAEDFRQQFSKVFTTKNQYQKRANEQRGDHVIYSLRAILKPLFVKVNRA